MAILTFIGRLLIVVALSSSAYLHIYQSHLSTKEFSGNYSVIDSLSQYFFQFDLPWDNVCFMLFRLTGRLLFESLAFSKLLWCYLLLLETALEELYMQYQCSAKYFSYYGQK